MRLVALVSVLGLALGLSGVSVAQDTKKGPSANEVEVTSRSISSDGMSEVTRTFYVDRTELSFHADSSTAILNSQPGSTVPETPDPPGNWVPGDATSVTIVQRGGGYERETVYERLGGGGGSGGGIADSWTMTRNSLTRCTITRCWPQNQQ